MLRPISTEIKIDDLEIQAAKVQWITLVIWLKIKVIENIFTMRHQAHNNQGLSVCKCI